MNNHASPKPRETDHGLDRMAWLCASATCLIALALTTWRLHLPGLYYDELLFVNAALDGPTKDFIRLRIAGVPILLMDYVGALKAWIYAPIFAVFPVGPWSVRLPAILFALGGTLMTFKAMWLWFDRRTAFITLALVVFDPAILTQSRLDWGPNALMFLLRGALLLCLAQWTRTGSNLWAWGVFSCLGIGLFDKLSFLWIAGAAAVAFPLIHSQTLRIWWRNSPRRAMVWLSLTLLLLAGGALRAIQLTVTTDNTADFRWTHRFGEAIDLLNLTLPGGGALDFVSGHGSRFASYLTPAILLCVGLSVIGVFALLKHQAKWVRPWLFASVFGFVIALAFTFTRTATGPHHAAVLSGVWQLALAAPLAALGGDGKTRILGTVAAGLAIVTALCMLFVTAAAIKTMSVEIKNPNWDPANWALGRHVAAHPERRFVFVDWGMGTQAIAASHARLRGPGTSDRWPSFTTLNKAREIVQREAASGTCYYAVRLPSFEAMEGNGQNLQIALAEAGLSVEPVLTLADIRGRPMIQVLAASPRPNEDLPKRP